MDVDKVGEKMERGVEAEVETETINLYKNKQLCTDSTLCSNRAGA